jgi:predicted nucleic acid-binding protein
VIVDTGPLVALLNRRDAYHEWMAMQVETLPVDWFVCEPVLAEAWYLVRRASGGQDRLLEMLETGVVKCEFELAAEARAVRLLCTKYRDVPMSLADACIVRMSELHRDQLVLTLDSDFTIYRRFGRDPLPLLSPGVP